SGEAAAPAPVPVAGPRKAPWPTGDSPSRHSRARFLLAAGELLLVQRGPLLWREHLQDLRDDAGAKCGRIVYRQVVRARWLPRRNAAIITAGLAVSGLPTVQEETVVECAQLPELTGAELEVAEHLGRDRKDIHRRRRSR